jgi:hypothetical protein
LGRRHHQYHRTFAMSDITIDNDGSEFSIDVPAQGPRGPAGTIAVGTVTTGAAGSAATVNNVGSSSVAILDFSIPRGAAATVAVGSVTTGSPGSSASVTNGGTTGAAVLNFTIPHGDTGAPNVGYAATSAQSKATVASGSVTFGDVDPGLDYLAGARIRAVSRGTGEWMEGVVTSYSGTSLAATMDARSGTGTHADWNINLAGEPGAGGAAGTNGTNGTNGASWSSGTAVPTGGNDGDFYLRTTTSDVYKKITGTWTIIANILGAPGAGSGDMLAANNLSDLANKATARTNLGVGIGTDVQAYSAKTAAIAALTWAADTYAYFTGTGAAAIGTVTSVARTLLAQTTQALMRTTGLGLTTTGDALATAASAAAARTTLGLATVASSGAYGDLSGAPAAGSPIPTTSLPVGWGGMMYCASNTANGANVTAGYISGYDPLGAAAINVQAGTFKNISGGSAGNPSLNFFVRTA